MEQLVFFAFKRYSGKFRKNHRLNEMELKTTIKNKLSLFDGLRGK